MTMQPSVGETNNSSTYVSEDEDEEENNHIDIIIKQKNETHWIKQSYKQVQTIPKTTHKPSTTTNINNNDKPSKQTLTNKSNACVVVFYISLIIFYCTCQNLYRICLCMWFFMILSNAVRFPNAVKKKLEIQKKKKLYLYKYSEKKWNTINIFEALKIELYPYCIYN